MGAPKGAGAVSVGELVFAIPGEPVPWAATKRNQRSGNRFLPARQEEAIARNVAAINQQLGEFEGTVFEAGVPLLLSCVFVVKRPKGHYGTGRNAAVLKDWAPARPTGKPDLSNLGKMIEDCLVLARVMPDDDQVVGHYAPWGKIYRAYGEQSRLVAKIKAARV